MKQTEAQGDPRLQFEKVEYSGQEMVRPLYDYIISKKVLLVTYKPFEKNIRVQTIIPAFLKEYNHRWYLIGYDADRLAYQNLALDRIEDVRISDKAITLSSAPDPDTYFNNLIGVSIEGSLEKVVVRVKKPRAFYIKTKRWHSSQNETLETAEYIDFEWTVYTNRELQSKILELGRDAEVIKPESLKGKIERI